MIVVTATVIGFLFGSIVGYYAGWAACAEDLPRRENEDMGVDLSGMHERYVWRWAIEGDKEWTTPPMS